MSPHLVEAGHIRLEVTDAIHRKEVANASATVQIVSPSKKSSSVDLKRMMSHHGGPLTFDEEGEYHFIVHVNVGGFRKSTKFEYEVK